MKTPRVVVDTNVLISAFRSRRGSAFALVSRIGSGSFHLSVSVPLVLEYEEILHRSTSLEEREILSILGFLCSVAHRQKTFYLWRPLLPDPKDDMVLELAVASRSRFIVTYNQRDFVPADRFGIESLRPEDLLRRIGV
jgi:putative PIN family toxin of toxin-antitoxin system